MQEKQYNIHLNLWFFSWCNCMSNELKDPEVWLDKNLVKSGQPGQVYESLSPGKSPEELEKANPKQAFFVVKFVVPTASEWKRATKTHPVGHNLASRVLLIDLDVFQNVYKPTASTTTFRVCKKRPFWGPKTSAQSLKEIAIQQVKFSAGQIGVTSSVVRLVPPAGTENTRGGARSKLWDASFQIVIHETVGNSAVILKNSKNVKNPSKQKTIQT